MNRSYGPSRTSLPTGESITEPHGTQSVPRRRVQVRMRAGPKPTGTVDTDEPRLHDRSSGDR